MRESNIIIMIVYHCDVLGLSISRAVDPGGRACRARPSTHLFKLSPPLSSTGRLLATFGSIARDRLGFS